MKMTKKSNHGMGGRMLFFVAFFALTLGLLSEEEDKPLAKDAPTSMEVEIPLDSLRVRLRPLTKEQLEKEADGWFGLLQAKIAEVGEVELQIHALGEEHQADPESEALTKQLIELRTAESDLIAHLNVVLTALKAKGGDVTALEQYIAAVSDLKNSADSASRLAAVVAAAKSWLRSPEGGVLFGKRIGLALVILFIFGIGYDDIPQAMEVLKDVAGAHELVLQKPVLSVEVVELGDSSVNLSCRPWVKTADYWTVFWELTRQVKMRFDQEGISIPYPQRDVHMVGGAE
jgi:hypothetical protein